MPSTGEQFVIAPRLNLIVARRRGSRSNRLAGTFLSARASGICRVQVPPCA